MSEKKTPQIRFKGFTDDWQERELGEVADRVTRKNSSLESSLPLTISSQHGLVDQISYFNNRVASRDVSNYYLMKRGEFAYNKSYSDGYPFGSVKCLNLYDMGVLSTLYIVFKPKCEFIKNEFLESFYETHNWHKDVAERAAEGARNHGLLNISAEDFFKSCLHFPLLLLEQTRIGEFFKMLDNIISSHQRKYDKLRQVKKSLLEKMFPQQGEPQPQIRFNGFFDDWLIDKIIDIAPLQRGFDIPTRRIINGNVPIVYSNGILNYHNEYTSKAPAVITGRSGTIGKFTYIPSGYYWAHNTTLWVTNFFNNSPLFIYYFYQTIKIEKFATGSGVPTLNRNDVHSSERAVPRCFSEQTRIGAFFKNLDDLITAQQLELDKLKSTKKALLEKMFV